MLLWEECLRWNLSEMDFNPGSAVCDLSDSGQIVEPVRALTFLTFKTETVMSSTVL